MIRRPAHKLGGTGQGALCTPCPCLQRAVVTHFPKTWIDAPPIDKEWVGGQISSRSELRRHARLAYVVACMHALHDRRCCADARAESLFGCEEALRARDPTSRPQTGRHRAGRTLHTRPAPSALHYVPAQLSTVKRSSTACVEAYSASAAVETRIEVMASLLAFTLVQPSRCAREKSPRHGVGHVRFGFDPGELWSPGASRCRAPEGGQHAVHEGVFAVAFLQGSFTGSVVDERQPVQW